MTEDGFMPTRPRYERLLKIEAEHQAALARMADLELRLGLLREAAAYVAEQWDAGAGRPKARMGTAVLVLRARLGPMSADMPAPVAGLDDLTLRPRQAQPPIAGA